MGKILFKGTVHGGPRNRLQLRSTGYFKRVFLAPRGRYGRFNGITDRSNHAVTDTGVLFWTDP